MVKVLMASMAGGRRAWWPGAGGPFTCLPAVCVFRGFSSLNFSFLLKGETAIVPSFQRW